MRILLVVAVLANTFYVAYGLCGLCMADSGAACVDEKKFQYCDENGTLLQPVYSCRDGTVCTSSIRPCAVPDENDLGLCNSCKQCNDGLVFACTTYNTFSLCYGSTDYNETVEYTCPGNLVCNIESKVMCTNPELEIGYTCPPSTLVTTTTTLPTTVTTPKPINPITDPKEFCEQEAKRGRFDVRTDTKCSKFIECKSVNGIWYGTVYVCPGNTFFNPLTQMCSKTMPPRCAEEVEVCD